VTTDRSKLMAGTKNDVVKEWFGEAFSDLHPQLQFLHCYGGSLHGDVNLDFGKGFAAVLGRRFAKRLGIPVQAGKHELQVKIHHLDNALHWSRCFNQQHTLTSVFKPFGSYPSGYWLEKTGPVVLELTVDILDHGWHWRVQCVRLFGLRLPLILFPKSVAYKKIVDNQYEFHVSFSIPLLGQLLCYHGQLAMSSNESEKI
jgi:Domain of unknown function (DUF4166)